MKKFILLISVIFASNANNALCMQYNKEQITTPIQNIINIIQSQNEIQQLTQQNNNHEIQTAIQKLQEEINQFKDKQNLTNEDKINLYEKVLRLELLILYYTTPHALLSKNKQDRQYDPIKTQKSEIIESLKLTKGLEQKAVSDCTNYMYHNVLSKNIELMKNIENQNTTINSLNEEKFQFQKTISGLQQENQALQNQLNQQNNNTDNQQDENTDNQQDKDNKPQDNNNQDPKQNSNVGRVTINTIHKTRENNNTNNNSESAKIFKIEKNSQTQIEIDYANVAEHLNTIDAKPKIIVNSSNKSPDIMPPSTNQAEANPVVS